MAQTMGCIGCGNMGSALLKGFAARLTDDEWQLCCYNRTPDKMLALKEQGMEDCASAMELAEMADLIILAVKPGQIADVLKEVKGQLTEDKTVVSIAAGIGLSTLRALAGKQCALARAMPTTTALAGRGVFAFCFDDTNFSRLSQLELLELFDLLGYCVELPEKKFTEFSALIGAGPAYVFAMCHAMQQAGTTLGFPAELSRQMIVELFAGCAELASRQPKSFMQMRDDVCSPGGLTIAGVNELDRKAFTAAVIDAVEAARCRGREMEA